MKLVLLAAAVLGMAGATVVAQTADPIAQRKAVMRDLSSNKLAEVGKMAKGEAPFDLSKVQVALKAVEDVSKTQPALFSESSKTGGGTTASPKIWENKADFDARYAKMGKDAADAAAKITDEASFKANFPSVTKNCGGCHELYRVRPG